MASPFLGEIKIVGFNFAPVGWALCNGQILSIQQNTALFSLIGTYYGGNGQSTFALPDLQSRVPVHQGQGPGLTPYVIGEVTGTETVTLLTSNLPPHSHTVNAVSGKGNNPSPTGHLPAADAAGLTAEYSSAAANTTMNPTMINPNTGGGIPISNIQPLLCLNFIIALQGIFPSRS